MPLPARTIRTPRAAISWSGGKDACLAGLKAREQGLALTTFVTMLDPGGASKSHALPPALIAAQVDALAGRWRPVEAGIDDYATVFSATLAALREDGHTHLVFGDIDLQAHRDWLVPRCAQAELEAVFPLWGLARAAVAAEVVERGIRARVVCVDTRWLDASLCGVDYDADFLARLPDDVCPCGEGGEFHTFVWDAPGFAAPLAIGPGVRRTVASTPPFAPTTLVFEAPRLLGDEHDR